MKNHSNDETIDINNTFTELFRILKKHDQENLHLDYTIDELNLISLYSDNAITSILHGLQVIGYLIADTKQIEGNELSNLGYFLSLVANLMDALNSLRADCELTENAEYEILNKSIIN